MTRPKILVFASGSPTGGGSGFEKLVLASRDGSLAADIVGVVSNNYHGGVCSRATKLGIPFIHLPKPWTADAYQRIAEASEADFFALSGWLKLVAGLDLATPFNPRTVFNIHPGPLPDFGGPGMHGHHVHEAVMAAYGRGEVSRSAVSMHFVTEAYDRGPVFFRYHVPIREDDTAETLGERVNRKEHFWQPHITNLVASGRIYWDGIDPASLTVPDGYSIDRGD